MFSHNIAVVALSALTVVSATSSNWTSLMDINKVPVGTRNGWCQAQLNACDQICSPPSESTCDFNTLDYKCACADGSDPKLGQYTNTIDYFTCQEAYSECNLANVGSKTGQDNCTATIQKNCGTKDPSKKESSGSGSAQSSSSAAPSPTSGGSSSATQSPESSEKPKSAGLSLSAVSYMGNGAAALAVAAFAYLM
ncbi:pci domain-containing protein [Apiospora aurea]|uniref:Pci domain-containing protein n=1 Tax=Apiospora aurea TaxID=335848 RepID=A0ABR1QCJ1_9PEZI